MAHRRGAAADAKNVWNAISDDQAAVSDNIKRLEELVYRLDFSASYPCLPITAHTGSVVYAGYMACMPGRVQAAKISPA